MRLWSVILGSKSIICRWLHWFSDRLFHNKQFLTMSSCTLQSKVQSPKSFRNYVSRRLMPEADRSLKLLPAATGDWSFCHLTCHARAASIQVSEYRPHWTMMSIPFTQELTQKLEINHKFYLCFRKAIFSSGPEICNSYITRLKVQIL